MDDHNLRDELDREDTPIERALFALECVAHLQGRERELLQLVEDARKEYKELTHGK